MRVGGNWNEIGKQLERNWKGLERIGEFVRSERNGSNARKRGKCQADGTDGVRYMVFVLKTIKYGMKNDFPIENCWLNRKNIKRC